MLPWTVFLSLTKRLGGSALSWLGTLNVWQLALGAALIFAGLEHFELVVARHEAAKWHKQFADEHNARVADRQTYIRAEADAKAKNLADIAQNDKRQQEISDARVTDLNARLERITRELRDNPAAKGSAGSTPLPQTGPAPCRAYDPAWLCLSPADRLLAAQNEERHDQLIDWVTEQSQLDPNAR